MNKIFRFIIGAFLMNCAFNSMAQCPQYEIINLKKIAIVFGEAKYQFVNPLMNPTHDADDITDSLKKIGFEVLTYRNDNFSDMGKHIDEWFKKIANYDVALFYYSGHGAEVEGQNYLFPIDANPQTSADLPTSAINATTLLARLDDLKNKYSIMILDACRSNPFTRSFSRGLSKGGLAFMSGSGTFIGFAASPGKVARDGNPSQKNSRNGIYTEAILKYITQPNLPIDQIFTKVNMYVRKETSDQQIPFKTSSFSTDYCFSVTIPKFSAQEVKNENIILKGSDIAIDSKKNNVFIIDKVSNNILVKDTRSLTPLKLIINPNLHPKEILPFGENILVIDSLSKTLFEIDWKRNEIISKIIFDNNPVVMLINTHNQTAYVGCVSNDTGNIYIIDLNNFKIKKSIRTHFAINDMAIPLDGKNIYATLNSTKGSQELIEVNIVFGKISKTTNITMRSKTMGISPKGNLFLFDESKNSIVIYSLPNFSVVKTIPDVYLCQDINFSIDGRQAYLSSGSELLYVTMNDFIITNSLKLSSKIGGVVGDNEGALFVSLPFEARVLEYDSHNPQTESFKEFKVNPTNEFAALVRSTVNSQKNIVRLNQVNKTEQLTSKVDSVLKKLQGEIPGHWDYSFGVPGRYHSEGFGVSNNMYSKELGLSLEWQTKTRVNQDTIIIVCRSEIGNIKKEDNFRITDAELDSFKSSMKVRWIDILTQGIKKKD